MAAPDTGTSAINNDDIVEISLHNSPSKATINTFVDSDQNKHIRRCFAPAEKGHNHGSDRAHPLRTMPFDSDIWIGNFEDLGSRVWPHPSFKELVARSLTGNSKFALPDTVAKETRFQSLRLRCCGDGCDQTIHGPDVEYEKPSRLEMLPFGQTKNVIIYPFFVGISGVGAPQKLFAIVHRHDNDYRFWKVDGTYHESFGLAKGGVSLSQSPRSARSINIGSLGSPKRQVTRTPTKPGKSAAQDVDDPDDTPLRVVQKMRALTRSRETKTQTARSQGEDPFADSPEPLSKRPNTGSSSVPSTIPTRQPQSRRSSTKESTCSLLHIKEVCMLAYHVHGPALKLLYGNDSFTIESGEGSLIDPTTESTFRLTAQHAQFVLYGRQGSLKVILSKNSTRSIIESPNEITGGVILLDFGGRSARDEFIARNDWLCVSPQDDDEGSNTSSLTQFDCEEEEITTDVRESPRMSLRSSQRRQQESAIVVARPTPQPPQTPQPLIMPQGLSTQPIYRGSVVVDLTDEDESSPIKQEQPDQEQPEQPHPKALAPYKTPTPTPISTPSIESSEDVSFTRHFGPDPLAEEYGRITTQIFQEYSMRVFALPEVTQLIQRMKRTVKAGDRAALCRAYGALQAFLISVE